MKQLQLPSEKYELIEELGQGGTATVYKALYKPFDQLVAVKFVNENIERTVESIKRLKKEAQALSVLSNPHIVRTLHLELVDDRTCALVMEYVEGKDLSRVIASEGKLSAERCRGIMHQSAEALVEAHSLGIIHRDLKPANILLGDDGTVKILDFGIAKILSDQLDQKLTKTGALIGTPAYMSPEQCESKPVDLRSDIYSLGCVIYHALTGKLPFEADSSYAMMLKHSSDRVPLAETADCSLAAIIGKCTAPSPSDRFQSATELLTALSSDTFSEVPTRRSSRTTGARYAVPAVLAAIVTVAVVGFLCVQHQRTLPPAAPSTVPALPDFEQMTGPRLVTYLRSYLLPSNTFRSHTPLLDALHKGGRPVLAIGNTEPPRALLDALHRKRQSIQTQEDLDQLGSSYHHLWCTTRKIEYAIRAREPLGRLIEEYPNELGTWTVAELANTYLPFDYAQSKKCLEDHIARCQKDENKRGQIPRLRTQILAAAIRAGEKKEEDRLRKDLNQRYTREQISFILETSGKDPLTEPILKKNQKFALMAP